MNEWYRKILVVLAKRAVLPFVPKYSTGRDEPFHLNFAGITRVSAEIASAKDPMLDFFSDFCSDF